jgi:hypothetical protein
MTDQEGTFWTVDVVLRSKIKVLAQSLKEQQQSKYTLMTSGGEISKVEELLSLCEQAMELRAEFLAQNQETGDMISGAWKDWILWTGEEMEKRIVVWKARLEEIKGQ